MSNIIQFEYNNPKNPEKFSYKLSANGNANIYNIATPKKYLKSDFVKYSYFNINGQQKPLCSKKSNQSVNCKKVAKPSQSKIITKITTIKTTDSLISRSLGKDNNPMNHFYILGTLKKLIDLFYKKLVNESNNSTKINNIKFQKYNYRKEIGNQSGGIDLVVSGTVMIILIVLLCLSSTDLCILYILLSQPGGGQNKSPQIIQDLLKAVGGKKGAQEIKDKIINSSFFLLKDNYYMYVKFSKNNLFQTMVEVPYIVKLENPEQVKKFVSNYSNKTQEIVKVIQQKLTEALSTSQTPVKQSFFQRMRGKVQNKATAGISKKVNSFNQKLQEMEKQYSQNDSPQQTTNSFF